MLYGTLPSYYLYPNGNCKKVHKNDALSRSNLEMHLSETCPDELLGVSSGELPRVKQTIEDYWGWEEDND